MSNIELTREPLTEAALRNTSPGNGDATTPAAAPSVSGDRARRDRRSGNRFPVSTSEFRGDLGPTGSYGGISDIARRPDEGVRGENGRTRGYDTLGVQATERTPTAHDPIASENPGEPTRRQQAQGYPAGATVRETPTTTDRTSPRATEQARAVAGDLDEAQRRLLAELIEINGQDSYDALTAGIGKLKKDEYLRLPNNVQWPLVLARDVGRPEAQDDLNARVWADVYALNKASAPDGADAIVFGFLRMEAVKAGWYNKQREVTFMDPVPNALRAMLTDFATVRDRLGMIKTAAFIVPMVAEHTFRSFGHHFITSDAATYSARYADTLRSCLLPDIATLLPPPVLYHTALHWVSPARAREVLIAQSGTTQIPDAINIRKNSAPAGTAILTTTTAVIDAMDAVAMADGFEQYGGFNLKLMREVTDTIKNDPTRYHKSYFAYGVTPLDAGEIARLESAKAEAVKFAPYAQAFINTLLRDAALGRARALQKHADGNPIQMRRAQTFFRAFANQRVVSIAALFQPNFNAADQI